MSEQLTEKPDEGQDKERSPVAGGSQKDGKVEIVKDKVKDKVEKILRQ